MSGSGPRLSDLSALKLAQLARELRGRVIGTLQADPIAIVGLSCRVPGAASAGAFWELVAAGGEAITEIPADRWPASDWYDPDVSTPGKSVTTRGGFLDGVDGFDAGYFGILDREANAMDPHQRLFLECAIEALEDAGLRWPDLRHSATGVFTASYHNDYGALSYADPRAVDLRTLTGTQHSVVANRLSYFLDLRGPSVSIDTACSSSLVAIHMACQSLRMGESDLAVAGGVSVILVPELMVALSKVGFMAPDGRCKTFDAAADGFGRGEGCGVLVLRRLSDAIAAGDRIHAVIRGTAVNQDGESTLLTAPNGPAQEDLIRSALGSAQIAPETIDFIEAHGTGTALGDPIEVSALAATVGQPVEGAGPCFLGSAKANIGHLEAAAGAVGTIKAVLTLQHRMMPPPAAFSEISPHIELAGTRLCIPGQATPFDADRPLRAGVSGFGVGGTNAHVVLEEAPRLKADRVGAEGPFVLPISARSPEALRSMTADWAEHLRTSPDAFADIVFTASCRRTSHPIRAAVVGADAAEAAERLDALGRSLPADPGAAPRPPAGPVFVFCGQGPQRAGMGLGLAERDPVFHAALAEVSEAIHRHSELSIIEELSRPPEQSRLADTHVAQAALFAVHAALTAVWRGRGIAPAAVIGHSIGEISALHAAGWLELDSAARLVVERGRHMRPFEGAGGMASLALDEASAQALVQEIGGDLDIAAVNAPEATVLSGDPAALQAAADLCAARGVRCQALPVRYAFHSAQMEPAAAPFRAALGRIPGIRGAVPVYSTVTGARLDAFAEPEHFVRNLRGTVRFADAVAAAARDGFEVFLEIGPHPVLAGAIAASAEAAAPGRAVSVVASLRKDRDEATALAEATAQLFAGGLDPDWSAIAAAGEVVSLPAYPWQRRRHWLPERKVPLPPGPQDAGFHTLLSRRVHVAGSGIDLHVGDASGAAAWLGDHVVEGRNLLPGAAILEAMAAVAEAATGTASLRDAVISAPVDLSDASAEPPHWQVSASPENDGERRLEWRVCRADSWHVVATATIGGAIDDAPAPPEPGRAVDPAEIDDWLDARGLSFGPSFRRLRDIRIGRDTASARATAAASGTGHILHPTVIDAGMQLAAATVSLGAGQGGQVRAFLPFGADQMLLERGAAVDGEVSIEVRIRDASDTSFAADLRFVDGSGRVVGAIQGARFAPSRGADPMAIPLASYETTWRPRRGVADGTADAGGAEAADTGLWLVVDAGDSGEEAARLVADFEARGIAARRIEVPVPEGSARADVSECDADVMKQLLATAAPVTGVLLCCGLDRRGLGEPPMTSPQAAALRALQMVQALMDAEKTEPPRLVLLTRGGVAAGPGEAADPDGAAMRAMLWAAAAEQPSLPLRALDVDPSEAGPPIAEIFETTPRWSALRSGKVLAPRVCRREHQAEPEQQRLERTGEAGADAVRLVPLGRRPLADDEVRIAVRASGLNFRDVLSNLGLYPGEVPLGTECMGIIAEVGSGDLGFRPGDRVIALAPWSHATEATAPAHLVAPAPPQLCDAAAAAMPVAFMTALYGLQRLAGLQAGDSVMIHAAAGGVGLAAVQIAHRAGARVYATAGSPEKRALLRGLGVEAVFDSRSLDFADQLLARTGDRGVDVVLNALSNEFVDASWRVLARAGRFVEIGKRGVLSTTEAALRRPDASYHLLDFGAEAAARPGLFAQLAEELSAAFADRSLSAPWLVEMPLAQAGVGLRRMAQAGHVGKIVLRASHPPFKLDPEAAYWITGGLGAIGLDLARWLVGEGARHIALSGRNAPDEAARAAIAALEAEGATVMTFRADAADAEAMRETCDAICASHALKGVVHAAGVLRDSALPRQTAADLAAVFRGKVEGARVLDRITEGLPLDFFVLFSSAGLTLGSRGQAAYVAANAALEALAETRRSRGRPALSVAWGPWAGAGMAEALRASGNDVWGERGVLPIAPGEALAMLARLISEGASSAMIARIDWPKYLQSTAEAEVFAELAAAPVRQQDRAPVVASSLPKSLRARPEGQRCRALLEALADIARQAIGLNPATPIPPGAALRDLGLDSLMAVELRNMLVREGGHPLPATLLFDHPTLDALVARLGDVWEIGFGEAAEDAPTGPPGRDGMDELSDEEALRQLEAELGDIKFGEAT